MQYILKPFYLLTKQLFHLRKCQILLLFVNLLVIKFVICVYASPKFHIHCEIDQWLIQTYGILYIILTKGTKTRGISMINIIVLCLKKADGED